MDEPTSEPTHEQHQPAETHQEPPREEPAPVHEERKEAPVHHAQEETKESVSTTDESTVRKTSAEEQRKNSAEPSPRNSEVDSAYAAQILERKRESFVYFQNIEAQRRNMVESHRMILINLVTNIDGKLQWIDTGIEKVVKFFKDRATQEEEYLKITVQGLPKLGPSFKDPNNQDLFTNLTKALEECDEFHVRQSKNGETLAKFLRKNILENIILASEKDFRNKLDALIAPLEDMKKKLANLQQERLKKIKNYVYSYNEAQRGGKITKDRDMFKNEVENLSLGYEELRIMKAYATQALLLVNETVKMLIKRFIEVQKAFNLYFQKYSELYGSKAANPELALQLVERFNSFDEVQQAFVAKNLLKPEDLLYIKQKSGKNEVTYQEVFDVLVNLPNPPDITRSPLVIKEWKAQRDAGLLKGYKPCSVVVTLDSNILVLEKSAEGEVIEADSILKLQNLKIMPREERKDGSIVDIVEVIPGFILDSKKKVSLKFDSVDGAEEFRHYLYNFYSTSVLGR